MRGFQVLGEGIAKRFAVPKKGAVGAGSLADGDVVVLGGMTEAKDSGGTAGLSFLPAFMRSKSESSSRSEIILVLQLTRI